MSQSSSPYAILDQLLQQHIPKSSLLTLAKSFPGQSTVVSSEAFQRKSPSEISAFIIEQFKGQQGRPQQQQRPVIASSSVNNGRAASVNTYATPKCRVLPSGICVIDEESDDEVVENSEDENSDEDEEEETTNATDERARPFVASMPSSVKERMGRVYGMKLIDRNGKKFIVNGHSDVYIIRIDKIPSCTCPDYVHICKHILFVYFNVLGLPKDSPLIYQDAFTQNELESILKRPTRSRSLDY